MRQASAEAVSTSSRSKKRWRSSVADAARSPSSVRHALWPNMLRHPVIAIQALHSAPPGRFHQSPLRLRARPKLPPMPPSMRAPMPSLLVRLRSAATQAGGSRQGRSPVAPPESALLFRKPARSPRKIPPASNHTAAPGPSCSTLRQPASGLPPQLRVLAFRCHPPHRSVPAPGLAPQGTRRTIRTTIHARQPALLHIRPRIC